VITLVRIDNRLLHGQILEAWVPRLRIERIVIADDDAAASPLAQAAMVLCLPPTLVAEVLPVAKVDYASLAAARQAMLLLFREVSAVGRAVAALAADSQVARKNGGIYTTRALSEEYRFNDVDGIHPDYAVFDAAMEQAKKTFLAQIVDAGRFTEVDWQLASKLEMPS